jgi:mannose-1-phosphate guanylyltransferase
MFIWSAPAIKEALDRFAPAHARGWSSILQNRGKYLKSGFLKLPKISIDYAVMEKAKNILVAEASFDWDDVGSWNALHQQLPHDSRGNTSQGNILLVDSENCLCLGDKKLIAGIGLKDLIIVETPDALLICPKDSTQRIKELVQNLSKNLR